MLRNKKPAASGPRVFSMVREGSYSIFLKKSSNINGFGQSNSDIYIKKAI